VVTVDSYHQTTELAVQDDNGADVDTGYWLLAHIAQLTKEAPDVHEKLTETFDLEFQVEVLLARNEEPIVDCR
jgi:dipeptidase